MTNLNQNIVAELREVLQSPAYAQRLKAIHQHYHNSKSEGRYRDGLLELFNGTALAAEHDLRAYAEADKVDMVVTRPGTASDDWLRVELKYQFVFDLARRVRSSLEKLNPGLPDAALRAQLNALPRNTDLTRITADCIGRGADNAPDLCDVFVMIVQDRGGASHPQARRAKEEHQAARSWRCPELYERGVRLHFLHEQMSLDAQHQGESYDRQWMEPTWDMLKLIHRLRPFNLQVAARTMAGGPFPLTSWLFTLDFTEPAALPADAFDLLSAARQASAG